MPSGSLSTPTISSSGLITAQVGTSGYLASGTSATKQLTTQAAKTVTPTASEQTVVNSAVYTTGDVKVAAVPSETKMHRVRELAVTGANGTYTPSSGKFFSSVTVNVPSSSGGGSSDNNCEAYHITSASAKLNFKNTGTVKVWGYGTATSGYMTSVYAFVGDGYYKSASWGSPTKTSASFSINADAARPAEYVSLRPAGDHRCLRRLVWNRKTVRSAKSTRPVNPGMEDADAPKHQ